MADRQIALRVENLCVGPRADTDQKILDDISFELEAGRVLGLIGEAGSGKTVLARALVNGLSGPLLARRGRVLFDGQDVLRLSAAELTGIRGNRIGFIGSNPGGALDPTAPIGSQIVEKLRSVRPELSKSAATRQVLAVLNAVRIPSPEVRFHEFPFQFSGGMMQRVLIVDALVTGPEILIADNITQALDVTVAAQIIRLIREFRDQRRTAILFISSSLPIVKTIADEIMVLRAGRIVERAKPEALIANPQHDYTISILDRLPRIWGADIKPPAARDAPTLMSVRNVERTYRVRKKGAFAGVNVVRAVRGMSLDIRAGENIGIVGESGCGKSTLTRLLAWLERPDNGVITFEGRNLSQLNRRELTAMRRSFQLLLQDPYSSLPARMPVGRIIAEPLLIHGLCRKGDIKQRVRAAMTEVGLDHALEHRLTVGLGAGERQRINIARALVLEPKLMILDETLSALDQIEQARLFELFDRLQQAHGFTYIFISHDMALVRRVCHRIAVMYLGRVVELADNQTLFENPSHPYSRALLSAIPTLDEHPFKARDYLLEGEPPSPVHIPPGCAYRSRCPRALDKCKTHDPGARPAPDGGLVACHLINEARPSAMAPGRA